MPNFLSDDDPVIDYLDEPTESESALRPFRTPKPRTPGIAEPPVPSHPIGAGDQATVRELITPQMQGPGLTSENEGSVYNPNASAPDDELRSNLDAVRKAQEHTALIGAARPKAPEPKWYQRLAAAAAGGLAGYSNASGTRAPQIDPTAAIQGIYGVPGYQRKVADWKNQVGQAQAGEAAAQENLTNLEKLRQLNSQEETAQVGREHSRAVTAGIPGQSVTSAIEHGGEVLGADGQPPQDRDGSVIDVGGKKIFFPSKGQQAIDKKLAEQQGWLEVSPEMADKLKDVGVQAGETVPPSVYSKYQQMIALKAKQPNLVHKEFTDENTGDVTMIAFDPATMKEVSRQVVKGVAKKRSPAAGVQLTPESIDYWAKYAGTTGQLPSLGLGSSGAEARGKILNRAPEVAAGDVATNRAVNKSDAASLAGMQKMRDSVVSFENTANANLDIFLKTAKPIIDSGSPLINQPLRTIDRRLLGSNELAAYDAARRVAINEVAKVTNNPTLAGQLSDAGRREVESLVPEEATLGQIYHVVGVLKQDMANRHKFLDQSLGEIKGRMGGGGRGNAGGPVVPKVFPEAQVHAYGVAHGLDDAAATKAIAAAGYTIQ